MYFQIKNLLLVLKGTEYCTLIARNLEGSFCEKKHVLRYLILNFGQFGTKKGPNTPKCELEMKFRNSLFSLCKGFIIRKVGTKVAKF